MRTHTKGAAGPHRPEHEFLWQNSLYLGQVGHPHLQGTASGFWPWLAALRQGAAPTPHTNVYGVHPLYEELIEEGVDNALLTQLHVPLCAACIALFVGSMVIVHISPAPYFTEKVEFGPWTTWTSLVTAVAFSTAACLTFWAIAFTKNAFERPVMWISLTVHMLAAMGHIMMMSKEQLVCRDMLGGSIQLVRIIQWMLVFPLLGLLVHSIQPARARTSIVTAVLTGALSIVSAFLGIMVRGSLLGLGALMTLSTVFFCDQLRMLGRFYSVMKDESRSDLAEASHLEEPSDTSLSTIVSCHMSKSLKLLYLRRFGLYCIIMSVSMVFTVLYFLVWIVPISDEFLACFYNMTELLSKLLYASLTRASITDFLDPAPIFQLFLEYETRLNEARKLFVRYVFHEIRVPFNTIALGIREIKESLPKESGGKSSELLPVLDAMNESADVISQTLDDVLSFSKMESYKGELELATFSIRETLDRTIKAARPVAAESSVRISIAIDETVPTKVIGDNHKIRQVMSNLISNAIKFSFKRKEIAVSLANVAVTNSRDSTSAIIRFSVRDDGPGISEQDQQRLFLPFSQIRPGELQSGRGSGLGLAICKEIVQKHGGKCGVVSQPGNGATFFFEIPFVVDTAPDTPATLNVINASNNTILTGHRALIVDDVSSNRKLIAKRLMRLGMHVQECTNGEEAVQTVKNSERFTVIIMDNVMPVMNGMEAAKALTEQCSDSFVVGLTGNALQEDIDLFIAAGARHVLSKPVNVSALEKILLEAVAFTEQCSRLH